MQNPLHCAGRNSVVSRFELFSAQPPRVLCFSGEYGCKDLTAEAQEGA